MAEQLNLRLEPALPRPGDVAPMWPTPSPEPFDSDDHLFEPTWGGHRVLAFVGPSERPGDGEVRIVDPAGRDLVDRLPELSGLGVRVAARSAVLDGELVVVDASGRADDDALRERLNGKPGRPAALLVFDILHLDGVWLLNVPLEKRRQALRRALRPGDEVLVVPAIAGEGRALHAAVTAQGIAGVLARQRTSPYLPGTTSRLWRFIATTPPAASAAPDLGLTASESPTAAAPVVALIRRLPLLFDE
jgi:ATP-dependent DNA ligase